MNPDGTINTVLWQDFSERSMHELAVKTKALVKDFYGTPQRYAYWDGFSTGGRQGYKIAQTFPGDYDGILAGAPAINWSRFITAELYPQIVMLRDLGAAIPEAKLNAANAAAGAACGGTDLGFLLDPLQCRYDPTTDAAALCTGVAGQHRRDRHQRRPRHLPERGRGRRDQQDLVRPDHRAATLRTRGSTTARIRH